MVKAPLKWKAWLKCAGVDSKGEIKAGFRARKKGCPIAAKNARAKRNGSSASGAGANSPTSTEVRSPTRTSTEVRSPTSTSTEVRSPTSTSTSTEAYTSDNFTATVTGGAGAGDTTVNIYPSHCPTGPTGQRHSRDARGRNGGQYRVPDPAFHVNTPRAPYPMPNTSGKATRKGKGGRGAKKRSRR